MNERTQLDKLLADIADFGEKIAQSESLQCAIMVAVTPDGNSTRTVIIKPETTLTHVGQALIELETQCHGIKHQLFMRRGTKPADESLMEVPSVFIIPPDGEPN